MLPPQLRATFAEMSEVAGEMVLRAGEIIANKDVEGAAELNLRDDVIDRLHRDVFRILLDERFSGDNQLIIDATLLSRYYERFADHAVAVAVRVVYLVTGTWQDDELDADDRHRVEHDHGDGSVPRAEP